MNRISTLENTVNDLRRSLKAMAESYEFWLSTMDEKISEVKSEVLSSCASEGVQV